MFRPSDFSEMRWNVHKTADLKKLEKIVSDIPEFSRVGEKRRAATIKYFCYMYDAGSPLARRITDLKERKNEAATLAGINIADETDYKYAEQLWKLTQSLYREIVLRMLKVQHHRTISRIVANEIYFEECLAKIILDVGEGADKDTLEALKKKAYLRSQLDEISNSLDKYYAELNTGDEVVNEKVKVVDLSGYRPESIASLTTGFGN